ncbi:MAG: NVEALA domain-containing protein [Clostridium sp.]|nr:NVEALA domain-containing protein [Clostridium sp.]
MKKTKIYWFLTAISICLAMGIWLNAKSDEQQLNNLILENVEALADLENIDGTWIIVDEIPCATSATEYRVDQSYVNCTDCESQHGKANMNDGKCTVIRPVPIQ